MVKVDEYARIRQAHRIDKLSVRQLARRFHHSRRKIREILGQPEPRKYQRRPMPSVVDPFKPVIDQILRADEDAPRKQRHTVAKVFRRLRDEHDYPGSYERVRQYLRAKGRSQRATFIPLDHDPGQRLEADFGHIHVDFPDGRRLVPVLLTTWAYSNCPFAIALPTERTEAILQFNAHLLSCCLRDRERIQAGQSETIGQRFARESDNALSLPEPRFDPCIVQPAKADKYQMVRFDNNRYSVPRSAAFQTVTVKATIDRIDVVLGSQVIATHPRSYGKHEQILDPQHYLGTLQRRPAALDHANVFRRWQLPAVFSELREALEKQHGPSRGVKHFVRVLQLLEEHAIDQVQRVIETSRCEAGYGVEAILLRVRRGSAEATPAPTLENAEQPAAVRGIVVPPPNLSQFNQFLSIGGSHNDRSEYAPAEDQPQTSAPADDERRVRGPGSGSGERQRELRAVPAAPDGSGSGGPSGQCAEGPHQAGAFPSGERLRHLRLQRPAVGAQAEDPRTGERRLDRGTLQLLHGRQFRNRKNAPGHCTWTGRVPAGLAGALLHGGRIGQSSGGSPEAISARPLPRPAHARRPLDLRRVGLSVLQSRGRRTAVPGLRRPLRTQEPADHQQPAVRGLGAGLSRRADDSGTPGSADAQVPHLRDEWRKLPLPRVDEGQEGRQGEQVNDGGRGNPRYFS